MASDALLPSVCWLWLTEALAARSATYAVAGGTVTRLSSERFGTIATVAVEAAVELRASWTPLEPDLVPHLLAFADVLSRAAGLPPIEPGVVSLPKRRRRPS
jgi:hypothetical protein